MLTPKSDMTGICGHEGTEQNHGKEDDMGGYRLKFGEMLKQQCSRLLPWLDELNRKGVRYVSRDLILKQSGLKDNELQKVIHDGNMPRHTLSIKGVKCYSVDASLRLLARWLGRIEYLEVE